MYNSGYFRKETYAGYKSYLKNLREYINDKESIYYLYQFDRAYIVTFLDHIFLDRNNSGQTRNNYLSWISTFCGWCVDKNFLQSRPTEGIQFIDKRHIRKTRQVIPTDVVARIGEWLKVNDPHFMIAIVCGHAMRHIERATTATHTVKHIPVEPPFFFAARSM